MTEDDLHIARAQVIECAKDLCRNWLHLDGLRDLRFAELAKRVIRLEEVEAEIYGRYDMEEHGASRG